MLCQSSCRSILTFLPTLESTSRQFIIFFSKGKNSGRFVHFLCLSNKCNIRVGLCRVLYGWRLHKDDVVDEKRFSMDSWFMMRTDNTRGGCQHPPSTVLSWEES